MSFKQRFSNAVASQFPVLAIENSRPCSSLLTEETHAAPKVRLIQNHGYLKSASL